MRLQLEASNAFLAPNSGQSDATNFLEFNFLVFGTGTGSGSMVVDSPNVGDVRVVVLDPARLSASIGNIVIDSGRPTASQTTVLFDIVVGRNSIPYSGDANSPVSKQHELQSSPANGLVFQVSGLGRGVDSDDVTDTDSAIVWFLYIGLPGIAVCIILCCILIIAIVIFAWWRNSKGTTTHHVTSPVPPVGAVRCAIFV